VRVNTPEVVLPAQTLTRVYAGARYGGHGDEPFCRGFLFLVADAVLPVCCPNATDTRLLRQQIRLFAGQTERRERRDSNPRPPA
jgi:hypothetical protein